MNSRGFHFAGFLSQIGGGKSKNVQAQFEQLAAVEQQAIELVRLLTGKGYTTVKELQVALNDQQLPAIDLTLVAAFLAGYYVAESYGSVYDANLFGEMSMHDSKDVHTKASLGALLAMMRDRHVVKLADRRTTGTSAPVLIKTIEEIEAEKWKKAEEASEAELRKITSRLQMQDDSKVP
ncbi:MAG: hypothetical protein Q7S26_03475 [bacterium]|nr:hypothetical protein [bacterium]